MAKLIATSVWPALKEAHVKNAAVTLQDLFAKDPQRATRYALSLEGLTYDFSRTHVTDEVLDLLVKLAEQQHLSEWRARLLTGAKVNITENRAALHTALRTSDDTPIMVDDQDVIPLIRATQKKMEAFVDSVRLGERRGATGKAFRTVVNIGIGGSDLGPRLAVSALAGQMSGPEVRFIANVDAGESQRVLRGLDPATTLFVVVSKTFKTQETLMNAEAARHWIVTHLGAGAVAAHFVAVSTNLDAVAAFGIAPEAVFPMWDWVGGRFSLWSAVGLSIALAIGWGGFKALLAGAEAMDQHFHWTPLHRNMPVIMGLLGVWYRNVWGTTAQAILPYDERLRELPRFLQQLEMESNGKSVTDEGECLSTPTAPVIFGECGTVGQHSFHQWLHQGTDLTPVDFIGVLTDDYDRPEAHKALLDNLKAQAEALCFGREDAAPYRTNRGNRPSCVLWLDRMDPYHLGLLLALYEHQTFVQSLLWGINAFDQWGVELGKKLVAERAKV